MKNMSFMLTTEQVKNQTKTVTRRLGWWKLKTGDIIQPVEKGMGLKKGEKVVKIGCPIRVVSTRTEPLNHITTDDCRLEGFPTFSTLGFVTMFCLHNKCLGDVLANRIEFEYLNESGK
jgi:hypothetical protein